MDCVHRDVQKKLMKNFDQKGTFFAKNAKNSSFLAFFHLKTTLRGVFGLISCIISAAKLFHELLIHRYIFTQLLGNILNLQKILIPGKISVIRVFRYFSHQD